MEGVAGNRLRNAEKDREGIHAVSEFKIQQTRFRIYRRRKSRSYLCVVSSTDATNALRIARQTFDLGRDARAIPEPHPEIEE